MRRATEGGFTFLNTFYMIVVNI